METFFIYLSLTIEYDPYSDYLQFKLMSKRKLLPHLLIWAILQLPFLLFAQDEMYQSPVPFDPQTKVGKLDNGLNLLHPKE